MIIKISKTFLDKDLSLLRQICVIVTWQIWIWKLATTWIYLGFQCFNYYPALVHGQRKTNKIKG